MGWWNKIESAIIQSGRFVSHILLLVIRLYWGWLLVIAGFGKLMNMYGVADFFASLHIPLPLFTAAFVAVVEIIGGISLFFGLYSRASAFVLIILFLTAYATAHQEALISFFTTPSLFIEQSPFLYLYAALVVFCFGPGWISIDRWLEKRREMH